MTDRRRQRADRRARAARRRARRRSPGLFYSAVMLGSIGATTGLIIFPLLLSCEALGIGGHAENSLAAAAAAIALFVMWPTWLPRLHARKPVRRLSAPHTRRAASALGALWSACAITCAVLSWIEIDDHTRDSWAIPVAGVLWACLAVRRFRELAGPSGRTPRHPGARRRARLRRLGSA